MTNRNAIDRHWQNLHEAMRTESINRRTFFKVAGAAAVAMGLSHNAAVAAPATSGARIITRGQAANNVLVYGSGQDISNLDPHTGHDYSITWGQRAVYDSLLRYEGNPAQIKPLLATEVTPNADATEWTIKLTDKAKFHDGSPVNADAVVWNFKRLLSKNLGPAWMFAKIMDENSAQVVDPTTIKVKLLAPFAPYEAVLPWLFVANPAVVQQHVSGDDQGEGWLKQNEAGSGPYTIKRWEIGNVYEFSRWADYWYTPDNGIKPVDSFIWRIIRESSTKRIAMETGEVQYGDNFTSEDVNALRGEGFTVNDAPSLTPCAIKLNNAVGPTSDINVRKALTQAFDFESAIEAVSGRGTVMEGPLASGLEPWHKKDLPVLKFNLDAAKQALAQSEQYKDGFDLEYVYVTGLAEEEQFGLILLETAAEMNINVKMTPLVWPDMVARASKPDTSPAAMCVYSGTDYVDPDNFLWQAYHSSQAGFWAAASHYKNPDLDKLLEEGRATSDQAKRKDIYDQAQLKLVNDAVEIWVYTRIENDAWVKELGNPYDPIMGGDVRAIGYSAK